MTTTMQTAMIVSAALLMLLETVRGHGMLVDPPQRSSMWRYGYSSPTNYGDNQLYCGGFASQWNINGGKCGICGDPYDAPHPRPNEVGGKYATGVIVKTYQQADIIDVAVRITANHKGYFVFKLCPSDDDKKEVTQECLDKHVLKAVSRSGKDLGEKYHIDTAVDVKHVKLQLPSDVVCTHCVLQWTYITGNSWGCNNGNLDCCVGCGHQENFVNCADIAITASGNIGSPITKAPEATTEKPKVTDSASQTTAVPRATPWPTTRPSGPDQSTATCRAVGAYAGNQQIDSWCRYNCVRHFCPATHCTCS